MGAAQASTTTAPHECVSLAREVSSDFSKAGTPHVTFPLKPSLPLTSILSFNRHLLSTYFVYVLGIN